MTRSNPQKQGRKRLSAEIKRSRKVSRIKALVASRNQLAGESAEVFADDVTRKLCCEKCGVAEIPDRTWDYWRSKSLAKLDRKFLPNGTNSFATHVSLVTIACLLAENRNTATISSKSKQVGTLALARTLESVSGADIALWAGPKVLMPDRISLDDLNTKIAEIVPPPSRAKRYRAGWLKRKLSYTRDEANRILKKLNHPQAR